MTYLYLCTKAPRRRVYPHVGFSCATRTMSSRMSFAVGGRPGLEMRAGTNDEIMPAWCWQTGRLIKFGARG